jgi:hypothetical protein
MPTQLSPEASGIPALAMHAGAPAPATPHAQALPSHSQRTRVAPGIP